MHADEIDPQAEAALERQRVSIPHNRYGLKLLRAVGRLVSRYQNRNPPAVGDVTDFTVPGPAGELAARRYRPDTEEPIPTVVFFHGGGYVFGDVETHDRLCRVLTRASGCALVSVEYRLAPEHPFPAAVEDAYAAVEWAAANRERLGGGDGLAVAGDSAGGTLASVSALRAAEQNGPDIDYQALLYPGVGVEEAQDSVQEHAGVVLDEADLRYFRNCYFGSEVHERNPYADPTNAGDGDLSNVAPATVVTAGFDPLRDGGKKYAEQLLRDGVDVTYRNYESLVHGFGTLRGVDAADEAVTELGRDLRDAF